MKMLLNAKMEFANLLVKGDEIMAEEKWFGVVRWCEDDLKNALEVQGYPVTENNISKLYEICNSHWFTDYMIERGWEYMYDSIGHGDGWDI